MMGGQRKLKNGTKTDGTLIAAGTYTSSEINIISNDPLNHYNPFIYRDKRKQYSDLGAFVHLMKSSLGTGILAMPMAMKNGGVVVGAVGTVLVGLVCAHCMLMLVRSAQTLCVRLRQPTLGMPETAAAAFRTGPAWLQPWADWAGRFVKTALFCTYIFGISEYVIFCAASAQQIIDFYWQDLQLDKRVYIAALVIPLVPMCQVRQMRHLVPFSAIANICMVVSFILLVYYLLSGVHGPAEKNYAFSSLGGVPIFISTVLFAMEGIGTVLPVENTMRNPRKIGGWCGVLSLAMCFVVFLFTCMGLLGYLTFGDNTEASITLSLPKNEVPAQVVNGLLAVAILCTCPLQFYVPCGLVWDFLRPHLQPSFHRWVESVLRVTLVCLCVTLAVAVPNLELVISLLGAVFFSTLGLLIPAVTDTVTRLNSTSGEYHRVLIIKNGLVVCLSIFTAVGGVYAAV